MKLKDLLPIIDNQEVLYISCGDEGILLEDRAEADVWGNKEVVNVYTGFTSTSVALSIRLKE